MFSDLSITTKCGISSGHVILRATYRLLSTVSFGGERKYQMRMRMSPRSRKHSGGTWRPSSMKPSSSKS